jgi:hypothetical protein
MYQKDLFTASVGRTAEYLAEGLYSKVYRMTNGKIVKIGENDGTRNWLEFCMLRREAGTLMPMMPEVHQVTAIEDGYYMAVMEAYSRLDYAELDDVMYSSAFEKARQEFMYYLQSLTGEEVGRWDAFNDIHSGNVMVCPRRGPIVTDPMSGPYKVPIEVEFNLH